jgi:hypothetical protein
MRWSGFSFYLPIVVPETFFQELLGCRFVSQPCRWTAKKSNFDVMERSRFEELFFPITRIFEKASFYSAMNSTETKRE